MPSPDAPPSHRRIAVLGASGSPDRCSNRAIHRLLKAGFPVVPINPKIPEAAGLTCLPSLDQIEDAIDTVTVYLSPARSHPLADSLIALRPNRVVFNPGAENPELGRTLLKNGIAVLEACTLIMLDADTF